MVCVTLCIIPSTMRALRRQNRNRHHQRPTHPLRPGGDGGGDGSSGHAAIHNGNGKVKAIRLTQPATTHGHMIGGRDRPVGQHQIHQMGAAGNVPGAGISPAKHLPRTEVSRHHQSGRP